jgi:hypothetical protein
MPEPPFDPAQAHRWFAVECNNLAWNTIESESRSPADLERLIHAAHASVWHWSHIGTPLHELRGLVLLTTAYCIAHQPDAARHYARRCLTLSRQLGEEQTAFDRATALASAALAARIGGDGAEAGQLQAQALVAAAGLDAEDRGVFDQLYAGPIR